MKKLVCAIVGVDMLAGFIGLYCMAPATTDLPRAIQSEHVFVMDSNDKSKLVDESFSIIDCLDGC